LPKLLRTINRLKDPRDLWLFLRILAMLIRLPSLIEKESLPDLLNRLDPGVSPGPRDREMLDKTAGFVDSLLKYRFFQRYGRCLMRSLTLFHFLRRQGWPVGIRFGVRKTGGETEDAGGEGSGGAEASSRERGVSADVHRPKADTVPAAGAVSITGHSWLVLEGEPFLEREPIESYAVTFSYP
jgi:hypothetical protein